MPEITLEEVKRRVRYDPETGVFTWATTRRGTVKEGVELGSWGAYGYKTVRLNQRSYKLHRLAWWLTTGSPPSGDVDHINGVRSDNRISNLRDVSRKMNLENRASPMSRNSTGLLGAYYDKRKCHFYARISHHNVSRHLGTFGSAEEAHEAYLHAKRELHTGNTL